jgi:chromate reductase
MHAHLVMGPEVVVGSVHNNFDDELYRDESGLNFMMESLGKLRAEILSRRPVAA